MSATRVRRIDKGIYRYGHVLVYRPRRYDIMTGRPGFGDWTVVVDRVEGREFTYLRDALAHARTLVDCSCMTDDDGTVLPGPPAGSCPQHGWMVEDES